MKTHLSSVSMVFFLISCQQLGEAKVSDLNVVRIFQQDVPRRQVSMHQVTLLQVVHPLHTQTEISVFTEKKTAYWIILLLV